MARFPVADGGNHLIGHLNPDVTSDYQSQNRNGSGLWDLSVSKGQAFLGSAPLFSANDWGGTGVYDCDALSQDTVPLTNNKKDYPGSESLDSL